MNSRMRSGRPAVYNTVLDVRVAAQVSLKSVKGPISCKGGATLETIIIVSLLLPIVFGLVMIGKLIDLRQVSELAGRYAAWQTTVNSRISLSDSQSVIVHNRFYTDPLRVISTEADNQVSHGTSNNRLWGQSTSSTLNNLSSQTDVQIEKEKTVLTAYSFDLSAAPVATGMGETVEQLGSILGDAQGNAWDIEGNGIVRASINIGIKANTWLAGSNPSCVTTDSATCIQSSSVIMSDGWSAGSDDHAKRRVRSLMPTSAAQPVSDIISSAGGLLFPELKGLEGAFGHVDMDVLPRYAR
ncbi:MAG: hypothetical protein KTR32_00575 [Granulosicoccus sp.]|nr:hypothetical protein [Granulosicoccus sp.]